MSIRLLNSGVIIGGKYQITAALGGNPVGITYAGTAVQTAQKVIIREFMPQDCCERAADGSIINAADVFEQEKQKYIAGAKILLANPGQAVTQVYELLEENGTVYTIMEYVEGISLDAYLTQNKNRFPVGRIQVLIQPLLADFARLQEMGFIPVSYTHLIYAHYYFFLFSFFPAVICTICACNLQYSVCDKVLTGTVGIYDCFDQIRCV